MSWSRGLGAVAALALAAGLAGCFQPLYSEAAHPGLAEDVRAIEVAPIKDRIGHYLADDLTTELNGTGQTPTPKYRLTVTVSTGTADADGQFADQRRHFGDRPGRGRVYADQGRWRRGGPDWQGHRRRRLRPLPAAL